MPFRDKEKRREWDRKRARNWRAENPELHALEVKRSRQRKLQESPELVHRVEAERVARWMQRHPGKRKEIALLSYYRNKHKHVAANAERRIRTRERDRMRLRAYRRSHPLIERACKLRRRGRELLAPGSHTEKQLAARIEYFGYACRFCHRPLGFVERMAIDHAIPLARGGSSWPANLGPACTACNSKKGKKTIFEFLGVKHEPKRAG